MNENKEAFYSYLDDFDLVTIIVPYDDYQSSDEYHLKGNDEVIDLKILEQTHLRNEMKLVCSFDAYILLNLPYLVENNRKEQSSLRTGKIVRSELFDNIYYYKKTDLGVNYQKTSCKFKLWSPVAKQVRLELLSPEKNSEFHLLDYQSSGIWRLVLEGNYVGYRYRYHVQVNGKESVLTDPYGIASDTNSQYNYIVDKAQFEPINADIDFSGNPLDAVVLELSVRDFSMDPEMNFRYPGKFLGLIEPGIKTPLGQPAGFDYLKSLGITHVQLMPVLDFAGVDEKNPRSDYNWGYNPLQYFVLEGGYATDPEDSILRINEFRKVINAFHQANIGVILDVVFNHVHDRESFPIERLVPGYAFRVDREGIHTALSGCKNDLATERKMVRKLIIDALIYWATEFHIDGFRFDLMGLIDFETMNEVRQELEAVNPKILVYGEGWKMHSGNELDRMAHLENKKVLHTIGFFNDRFRDGIKGSTFHALEKGFATGDPFHAKDVAHWVEGSARQRWLFKYTSQSVNYVECHDNLTFMAKALLIQNDPILARKQARLALAMTVLSQGLPFIHLGQEFYRVKDFCENSFKAGDDINQIHWRELDLAIQEVEELRTWIRLRRRLPKLKSHSDLVASSKVEITPQSTVLIRLDQKEHFLILFKPLTQLEEIVIPKEYHLLYTSISAITIKKSGTCHLNDIGVCLFQGKDKPNDEF